MARLNAELTRSAKEEDRRRDARAELDRYREPLLLAAIDAGHRIRNIREQYFFDAYLGDDPGDPRHRTAVLGTLHRFARYWAVVEDLYTGVSILRFEQDEQTRGAARCLRNIGSTFASDSLDGGRLMFWREEQRAVAELMHDGDPPRLLGFAAFVSAYPDRFASWLDGFAADLTHGNPRSSERLARLQHHYGDLARVLDPDGLLRPDWEKLT